MNSKYVKSYFVQKYESGIYSIVFNTSEKWMYYHRYTNTMFSIAFYKGDETMDEYLSQIQDVPEFLPQDVRFISTTMQDKDQITYYFIPRDLIINGETILNEKIN